MNKYLLLGTQAMLTLAIGFMFIVLPNIQGITVNFETHFISVILLAIGIAGTTGTYWNSKIGFYFSLQFQYFSLTILLIGIFISLNNFSVGLVTALLAILIVYTIIVLNMKSSRERYGFRKNTIFPNILMSVMGLILACSTLLFYNNDQTTLELPVEVEFRVLGFGVCEATTVYNTKSLDSPSGRHTSSDGFRLVEQTNTIPSTLGAKFGMEYLITSDTTGYINVEQVWKFPQAIIDNKGKEFSEIRYMINKPLNDTTYSIYTLEEEFERVSGEWIFQMYYSGDLLYEQSFNVQ